jgi:hypothetical protein
MNNYFQTQLHENDVLYARGNGANDSTGNKRYRKEIRDHKLDYQTNARNNKEKELIARKVMEKIRLRGGRFFHYPTEGGQLCDAPDHIVLSKVKQALREKRRNAPVCVKSNSSRAMKDIKQEEKQHDDDDNSISMEDITDNSTNNNNTIFNPEERSLIRLISCTSFQKEATDDEHDYFHDSIDAIETIDPLIDFDEDIEDESALILNKLKKSFARGAEIGDGNKNISTKQEKQEQAGDKPIVSPSFQEDEEESSNNFGESMDCSIFLPLSMLGSSVQTFEVGGSLDFEFNLSCSFRIDDDNQTLNSESNHIMGTKV